MLIGLVGSPSNRKFIIDELLREGAHPYLITDGTNDLGTILPIKQWQELARMKGTTGVVAITNGHLLSKVRENKGVIWHILGVPSSHYPMASSDLMVAVKEEKSAGRILTVREALSESIARIWKR